MNIPKPKANFGDVVLVHNYRRKTADGKKIFETGKITGLEYRHRFNGKFAWSYEVVLERKSAISTTVFGRQIGGNTIRLYVGNDGIKKG